MPITTSPPTHHQPPPHRPLARRHHLPRLDRLSLVALIILALTLLITTAFGFYQGLTVTTLTLYSPKISSTAAPLTIALLTDLHSNRYGPNQSELVAHLTSAHPDLILLAGDIIDDKTTNPRQPVRELLDQIVPLAPTYYVTGNHEKRFSPLVQTANLDFLADEGVTLLDQQVAAVTIRDQTVLLAGATDPEVSYRADWPDRTYQELLLADLAPALATQTAAFQILLAHRPEDIDLYAALPIDLVVSGHAHGGHWRLPGLIAGFYSPNQGLFPTRVSGLYQDKTNSAHAPLSQIVSRGLDQSWTIPRLFNPPELIIIKLQSADPADP